MTSVWAAGSGVLLVPDGEAVFPLEVDWQPVTMIRAIMHNRQRMVLNVLLLISISPFLIYFNGKEPLITLALKGAYHNALNKIALYEWVERKYRCA